MKKNLLKIGGFIGLAAVAGYKVYSVFKERKQLEAEQGRIDVTPVEETADARE